MKKKNNDNERLYAYAERFFMRHEKTQFPTVREAARALGWRQQYVADVAEGDPDGRMMLTSYFVVPEDPLGDHFVETCEWEPSGD